MNIFLTIIFVLVSVSLIIIIMAQKGKQNELGNSFGIGASTTLFGSSGSGGFLSKITILLASLFFIISLIFGNLTTKKNNTKKVISSENNKNYILKK